MNPKPFIAALLMALGAIFFAGCSTVTPKPITDRVASFDGTNQNSGFVGYLDDGRGVITTHARDRYNLLVERYRKRFQPPLEKDDGVRHLVGDLWTIDPQHLVYFMVMNQWRKAGK